MIDLHYKKAVVTLNDFEIRYRKIRLAYPNVKKCSVVGCKNPHDFTLFLGEDICCAYHRLLFDFWSVDVAPNILKMTQKGRRRAFTNWMNRLGKPELDKIVLKMAHEPINWEC